MNRIPDRWMSLRQNAYDMIRFVEHSNPEEVNSMGYYRFFDRLNEIVQVQDAEEFRHAVDQFKMVLLDLDTGEWTEIKDEVRAPTFEELVEINKEDGNESVDPGQKVVSLVWENNKKKGLFGI